MILSVRFGIRIINKTNVAQYSIKREARILKKLLDRQPFANKGKINSGRLSQELILPGSNNGSNSKRVIALNKIYTQHVTGIMAAGQNTDAWMDLGLEISKVKINSNLKTLNIYWIQQNENTPNNVIANVLAKTAADLQQELTALRVIGRAPEIKFVKDVLQENSITVARLLEKADFGPDHVPIHPSGELIEQSDNIANDTEMRHDILGLNHLKITNRILAEIKKRKVIGLDTTCESGADVTNKNLVDFERKSFLKFYQKKKILEKKMNKMQLSQINEGFEEEEEGELESIDYDVWSDDDDDDDFTEKYDEKDIENNTSEEER